MAMLADRVDGVVGIDTHRDTLTAAGRHGNRWPARAAGRDR
jgi:hypothetical protein